MSTPSPLEQQAIELFSILCAQVRALLYNTALDRASFEREIEYCRRTAEQAIAMLYDETNRFGTGEEVGHDPCTSENGANECGMHFVTHGGSDAFARQYT